MSRIKRSQGSRPGASQTEKARWASIAVIIGITTGLAVLLAGCDDSNPDTGNTQGDTLLPTDDSTPTATPTFVFPGSIDLVITADGGSLSETRLEFPSMFLTITNETPEAIVFRVEISGSEDDAPSFGLAPYETREELVDIDPNEAATLRLEGLVLYVDGATPQPTTTRSPRPDTCPHRGDALGAYRDGYSDGLWFDLVEDRAREDVGSDYLSDYRLGYAEGHMGGVAHGYHGNALSTPSDFQDYTIGYQRGFDDGMQDGFSIVVDDTRPPDYGDRYFEGYFDALTEEESLC